MSTEGRSSGDHSPHDGMPQAAEEAGHADELSHADELDEATRVVVRGAAVATPKADSAHESDDVDETTRMVRRSPERDESTRIVDRSAVAAQPAEAAVVLPEPEPEPEPSLAEAGLTDSGLPEWAEATNVVYREVAAARITEEMPEEVPEEESEQDDPLLAADLDDATRIVVRSMVAYSTDELPSLAQRDDVDDATRIVSKPASSGEGGSLLDDSTRIVVRSTASSSHPTDHDDETRVVSRNASSDATSDSAGDETSIVSRGTSGSSGASVLGGRVHFAAVPAEQRTPQMPETVAAALAAQPASESLTSGEREIYKPRANPAPLELNRTVVTPPTREAVAPTKSMNASRRAALVLGAAIAATALVVGAIVVAAVLLIAAL